MIDFGKFNIDTHGRTSGRMKTHCPQCRDNRRDKRDKSLSVNLDTGLAYCHYCNWKCNARVTKKPQAQAFTPPQPAVLKDEHVRWFAEKRGIPASVLIAAGVTSADEYMPQTGRKESCICFNYYEGNRLVNTKFRDLNKNFKFVSNAELIPYNLNSILGEPECTITEGEPDTLALMAIGRKSVISVPGGANRNLSWMDRFFESHFEDKKVIYICVDTDRKGLELRDELVRRLGAERCRIVDLSPAKDANELLLEPHGAEALKAAFENAPQAPLEGVFTAEDLSDELRILFDNGLGSGAETGHRPRQRRVHAPPLRQQQLAARRDSGTRILLNNNKKINVMKTEITEKTFATRGYSKAELAGMYLPDYTHRVAMRKFNMWLRLSPILWGKLTETNVNIKTRSFNPVQVAIIVDHLGDP